MRRIVVTGARSPLGRAVVDALRASPTVEMVRGVENRARTSRSRKAPGFESRVEVVPFMPDHRPFAGFLAKEAIDTVIQCGVAPDRAGTSDRAREADVIATMCVGAAIGQKGSGVRNWVVASSSDIYSIGSHSPLLNRESESQPREEETLASSIAEAEEYARDLALRLPHVNVAILRLQQLIGPGVRGPLAALLACDPTPSPIGFDPAIQLLHLDDAAAALAFAAKVELAGVYNVASAGTIRWHEALDVTGRPRFPVLPVRAAMLEPLLARLKIPFLPAELHDLLLFGHAVDTQKIERAGWKAQYDQQGCLFETQQDPSPSRTAN